MRVMIKRILRRYGYPPTNRPRPLSWYWSRLKCCKDSGGWKDYKIMPGSYASLQKEYIIGNSTI